MRSAVASAYSLQTFKIGYLRVQFVTISAARLRPGAVAPSGSAPYALVKELDRRSLQTFKFGSIRVHQVTERPVGHLPPAG
jgi:hypothetical protein